MSVAYADFLASKRMVVPDAGIEVGPSSLHPSLFAFERDLIRWSLRKGRAALFCAPGMGKTFMQLEWARVILDTLGKDDNPRCLILAPLAVALQTVEEGGRWGITVTYVRDQKQVPSRGIAITNYEMLKHFDPAKFSAVVLDESSILKSMDGKTRTALIQTFRDTPYRLCCTATPAPNDTAELTNHAEFLGIMTRVEMLAAFFVHDDTGWRLRGHAREPFYRWLASWSMTLRQPSDLGYANDGYDLPPLEIIPEIVRTDWAPPGQLFPTALKGITERSAVRRDTAAVRVKRAIELIDAEPGETWAVWTGLNAEQDALAAALGDRAISVYGSLSPDEKADRLFRWLHGERPILLTKPSIAGFGINMQRCSRMAFVGLSDSYESYYQAIRRCWRFGQTRPVRAHIVLSEPEEAIYANVLRKEREAEKTGQEIVKHIAEFEKRELVSIRTDGAQYGANTPMLLPQWLKEMRCAS